MNIREAHNADFPALWHIIEPIVRPGDTYSIPVDITEAEARTLWLDTPLKTFVAEEGGRIFGTYKLSENRAGPGSHVANCGYMVAPDARGQGIASMLCQHSQEQALELGFKAMQFNMVVSTNTGAVRLWQKHGFDIIGTLPRAYNHSELGYVDGHIMYKWLAD